MKVDGEGAAGGISVISPSRDNPDDVIRFLSIVGQARKHFGHASEVIVVDDSAPDMAREIRGYCAEYQARYVRGPRRVGAKRNLGAAHARYDILLFVDSDCAPAAELLSEHARLYGPDGPDGKADGKADRKDAAIGAVAGPILVRNRPGLAPEVARRAVNVNAPFGWAAAFSRLGWAPTANLSVRAAVFRAVGGFDERAFTVNGGEDVDLGMRIGLAGWQIAGNPAALVETDPEATVGRMARKVFRYGRADVYLRTRHPLRGEPHLNRATMGVTASALAAAAGLATRSWPVFAGLSGTGWLAALAMTYRDQLSASSPKVRPVALATAIAIDIAFDLGTAVEAIRRGHPSMVIGRFSYYRDGEFVRNVTASDESRGKLAEG